MPRRVSKAKLHRRLAEGSKLRIYRVIRQPSKCIACATKLFSKSSRSLPTNKRPVIKENPTLIERMKEPFDTSGTPLGVQWWLQNEKGELLGPFGEACGGKAVVASWTKEKRDAMRQDLLSRGVPAEEVEDRLEQIAMKEWREMLRVYRKAEREAKKLNIDITTMTYDEVIAAIAAEKERVNYEYALHGAERQGVTVERIPGGGAKLTAVVGQIGNISHHTAVVENRGEVTNFLISWGEAKQAFLQTKAKQVKGQNRSKYPQHVEFLEWAIEHPAVNYLKKRELEDWLSYVEQGRVYPTTIEKIEDTARNAAQWVPPWTVAWPPFKAKVSAAVNTQTGAPVCPKCGLPLVRKSGTSKYGRPYDFYSCTGWKPYKRGCDGTMSIQDYNAAVAKLAAHGATPAPTQPSPPPSPPSSPPLSHPAHAILTKAEEAARKLQLKANGPQNGTQNRNQPEPPPEEGLKAKRRKRKKNAFWS